MVEGQAARMAKTRQQIEDELLIEVQRRHDGFKNATTENRIAARNEFATALVAFNNFVLRRKISEELVTQPNA